MYTTWDASLQDLCGRIPWGTSHLETLLLKNEKHIKISKKQYSKKHQTNTQHTHVCIYILYIYISLGTKNKLTINVYVCGWFLRVSDKDDNFVSKC